MRQRVADVLHSSVIETRRKEQEEFSNRYVVDKTCGIQKLPYRDSFGEFTGCRIVEARRNF